VLACSTCRQSGGEEGHAIACSQQLANEFLPSLSHMSFRDGFSRRALFLFRSGMTGFPFKLVGLPL
jgi:hypothetical protein